MIRRIKYFDEFEQENVVIEFECELCFDSGIVKIISDMDGLSRNCYCKCKAGKEYLKEMEDDEE